MNKKGAHVSLIFSKGKMSGVINKINQFSPHFKKNGVDVFVLNRDFDGLIGDVIYINYEKYFISKLSKVMRYSLIKKCIDLSIYDFVILRYPLFDFSALFFRSLDKVYFEHHSIETNEILKAGFSPFIKYVQYYSELIFAPIILRRCLGHISVTSQISDYEKSRFNSRGQYFLFSNGIELNTSDLIEKSNKYSYSEMTNVKFVFIASEFKTWHGLDRLIKSLDKYAGETEIIINLVGEVPTDLLSRIKNFNNKHVKFFLHGVKSREETLNIIIESDVGIDSLGLDRLGFKVSSTLKSKEYVVYSKPFITSVPDQDLLEFQNNIWLKLNFEDDFFDMHRVLEWYFAIDKSKMNFPLEQLTWKFKVNKLLNQITNNNI